MADYDHIYTAEDAWSHLSLICGDLQALTGQRTELEGRLGDSGIQRVPGSVEFVRWPAAPHPFEFPITCRLPDDELPENEINRHNYLRMESRIFASLYPDPHFIVEMFLHYVATSTDASLWGGVREEFELGEESLIINPSSANA